MKRALMVGLILALVSFVGAQTTVPGGGGGAVTITGGTTATSGCASPGPLISVGNVVTCAKLDQTDYLTADEADVTGAYVDSGLSITLASGQTYIFEVDLIGSTAVSTTGLQVAFNGPTNSLFSYTGMAQQNTTASVYPWGTTYDATNSIPTSGVSAAQMAQRYWGIITTTAAGDFVVRYRTEVGTSSVSLLIGSKLRVYQP